MWLIDSVEKNLAMSRRELQAKIQGLIKTHQATFKGKLDKKFDEFMKRAEKNVD